MCAHRYYYLDESDIVQYHPWLLLFGMDACGTDNNASVSYVHEKKIAL